MPAALERIALGESTARSLTHALDITMTFVRTQGLLLLAVLGCVGRAESERPIAQVPTDSTCEFSRVSAHPDAVQLLTEFTSRDARGEFTRSSAWFNGAVDCPGHEGGPDGATVVKGHQLRVISRTPDSVRAVVTWNRVGYVGEGAEDIAPGVDVDTLLAIRTAFGWRIASPALNPHVPAPSAPRP